MNYDDLFKWLPLIMSAVTEGQKLLTNITKDLQQAAELTPEQETQRDAWIAQMENQSWWKVQDE